jgi:hypothetical protein
MHKLKLLIARWLGLQEVVIVRLDEEVLAKLAASLPAPAVSRTDTEAVLGFNLGVQLVIDRLRTGLTVKVRK